MRYHISLHLKDYKTLKKDIHIIFEIVDHENVLNFFLMDLKTYIHGFV